MRLPLSLASLLIFVTMGSGGSLSCAQTATQNAVQNARPAAAQNAATAFRPLLVVVSIDGLRADALTDAEAHGVQAPFLQSMRRDGTWAEGVTGVLPTYTYPSHTTLVSGVAPARHGVYANQPFDPEELHPEAWNTAYAQVRVPTLWTVARAAHINTAAVNWPVTEGAPIDENIPEFWSTAPDGGAALRRVSTPPGMLAQMEGRLGVYPSRSTDVEHDANRTAFALAVLRTFHPGLLAVHLAGLDHEEHAHGPWSAEAVEAIQSEDALVKQLYDAARAADPSVVFCVVSDHGFEKVDRWLSLKQAFADAGLIRRDATGRVTQWRAAVWPSGGTAAIVLHDPADDATRAAVLELLHRLQRDRSLGIDQVLDHEALASLGGYPDADFLVTMRPGFGVAKGFSTPLLSADGDRGAHGFLASDPALRSVFLLTGPGIRPAHGLGIVDMRSIAPTLAAQLGLAMPSAELPALPVR